jgi:DNA-binding transcriptional regulator YiaG
MAETKVKTEARELIEDLPEDASWDELMHRIYVRQTIEKGLEDSRAGRTVDVKEVRRKFGLSTR